MTGRDTDRETDRDTDPGMGRDMGREVGRHAGGEEGGEDGGRMVSPLAEADQAITMIEPELVAAAGSGSPDGAGDVDVSAALRAALRVLGRT